MQFCSTASQKSFLATSDFGNKTMKNRPLADELRLLVSRHGFEAVNLELQTLEKQSTREPNRGTQTKTRRRNGRVKAPEYVQKMDIGPDKRAALSGLAERFEAKSFLPTCADIRNFCAIYGIDEPASKSRAAAIPRLFKCLAAMATEDVNDLLAHNAFSGPTQLAPIAEAIRQHGRARRNLGPKGNQMPAV